MRKAYAPRRRRDDPAAAAGPYPAHRAEERLHTVWNPPPVVRVIVDQDLAIKDVAEQTGIAAGTIRMWEQRYGFPEPERTSSGYRVYRPGDVEALRRVQAYRHRGLSIPPRSSAPARRASETDRPSIYAAVMSAGVDASPQVLRKSTLVALSRAIEHETLAHAAAPVLFAAFQREPFYREVEPRYARIAQCADAADGLRRLPAGAPPGRRSRRDADRADATRSATSGPSSSTRPGSPRASWPGSSPGSPSPATRTTSTAASRRSGRSTRSRRAARRSWRRAWPSARTPPTAARCWGCSRTARWRSRSPPRRSPR